MLPRLIATDLDGTFLDANGAYDCQQFDAILGEMTARGSRFVVTTGDPLDHVQELFAPLRNRAQLTYVVEDGALITTAKGNQLQMATLPQLHWQTAVSWLETAPIMAGCFIIACGAEQAYTTLPADSQRFAESREFYPSLTSVADFTMVTAAILKLDITWLKTDVVAQVTAFNARFAGELVGVSSGLGGMNVARPNVSKAAGLDFLGRRWGITPAEMAAFGDSGNDLTMLQLVGQGLAVANAAPELATQPHLKGTNEQGAVMAQIAEWLV